MITKAGNVSTRILLFALTTGCATVLSAAAWAAAPPSPPAAGTPIEGCDQRVLDAQQSKARALTVYDKAVTAQNVYKPDSQLTTGCFNKIGGTAENEGGQVFSGNLDGHYWSSGVTYPYSTSNPPVWTTDTYYSTDIEDNLNGFYDDFQGATGDDGGTVDYTTTTLNDTQNCTYEEDLWGDPPGATQPQPAPTAMANPAVGNLPGPGNIRGAGIEGGDPFVDDDALMGTTPTGMGTNYQQEITTDTADLTDYQTKMNALQSANIKPVVPTYTDGTISNGQNNSCSVLQSAGIATSCP